MRVDDGGKNGEPCAVVYPKNKSVVAVVFPVAENLEMIQKIIEFDPSRPLLVKSTMEIVWTGCV